MPAFTQKKKKRYNAFKMSVNGCYFIFRLSIKKIIDSLFFFVLRVVLIFSFFFVIKFIFYEAGSARAILCACDF